MPATTRISIRVTSDSDRPLLHRIPRILDERVMYVPVYELGPMVGIGLRVDEAGVGLILR